jgi:hypothetical protein
VGVAAVTIVIKHPYLRDDFLHTSTPRHAAP